MNKCKHYNNCDDARKYSSYCNNGIDCFEDGGDSDTMPYYCGACDIILEDDELGEWADDRGYYGSEKVTQKVVGCPKCGGEVESTVLCDRCHDEVPQNSTAIGICNNCVEEALSNMVLLSNYVNEDSEHYIESCIDWWKEHGEM